MAKMFYSLEEAARKLDISQDQLRDLAASGQIQQFRDRDKVMFKREQIDDLVEERSAGSGDLLEASDSFLDADSSIPLAEDSDAIDLMPISSPDEIDIPPSVASDTQANLTASGHHTTEDLSGNLSEVTQMSNPPMDLDDDDEDLVLEQIGSGSGLLDLTRESDDTSLGTELLDEIYPSPENPNDKTIASDQATGTLDTMDAIDAAITSSSIFDGAVDLDISTSGLENLQDIGEPSSVMPPSMTVPTVGVDQVFVMDPAGNGLGIGMLLAALAALFTTFTIVIYALRGVPSSTTASMAQHSLAYSGGFLAAGIVLGVAGMFLGKVQKR